MIEFQGKEASRKNKGGKEFVDGEGGLEVVVKGGRIISNYTKAGPRRGEGDGGCNSSPHPPTDPGRKKNPFFKHGGRTRKKATDLASGYRERGT